jgi:peptide/nickel transport system substrate-binding protein
MKNEPTCVPVDVPARRRTTFRRLAIACCAVFLALPGVAGAASSPQRGGILPFAVDAEPPNYDCHANFSFVLIHVVAPHYSTLLKFDTANYPQVVGDLAESWTVSPDRRTYTFKLRPNVLFHDGSKLTSADVKASYERIIHPPQGVLSVRRADYAAITSIDTPDPLTVVFHLQWPDAAMLANFASPWNCVYSAAKLAEDPNFPKTHILGTGPFVFVEHVKGDHWSGKRWEKYFQPGKPYLDG